MRQKHFITRNKYFLSNYAINSSIIQKNIKKFSQYRKLLLQYRKLCSIIWVENNEEGYKNMTTEEKLKDLILKALLY